MRMIQRPRLNVRRSTWLAVLTPIVGAVGIVLQLLGWLLKAAGALLLLGLVGDLLGQWTGAW